MAVFFYVKKLCCQLVKKIFIEKNRFIGSSKTIILLLLLIYVLTVVPISVRVSLANAEL